MLIRELEETGNVHFLRFYARRWFRIMPAYASVLVVSYFFDPRAHTGCPKIWWSNLLFINNYFSNLFGGPTCMVHSWSIAVEVQMYVLTPPFLLVGYALRRCGVPWVAAYLSAIGVGWLGVCALRLPNVNMLYGNVPVSARRSKPCDRSWLT